MVANPKLRLDEFNKILTDWTKPRVNSEIYTLEESKIMVRCLSEVTVKSSDVEEAIWVQNTSFKLMRHGKVNVNSIENVVQCLCVVFINSINILKSNV